MNVTVASKSELGVSALDRHKNSQRDQTFFVAMAITTSLIIVIGFARTYYLKWFTGAPSLSRLVHVHAAVFTTWVALFLTQTALVANGQTRAHRRLGVAGVALAAVMVVVGFLTAVAAARRGLTIGPLDPLGSLVVPVVDGGVFAVLVATGLSLRSKPEFHRRLMLLSMVALTVPATGRIPLLGPSIVFQLTVQALLVLAGPVYDRLANKRVHPTFVWGGLLIMLGLPVKLLGLTEAWRTFASWLVE